MRRAVPTTATTTKATTKLSEKKLLTNSEPLYGKEMKKTGRKRMQPNGGPLLKRDTGSKKRARPVAKSNVSSYHVFNEFISFNEKTGSYDASQVLSRRCFQRWLQSRRKRPKMPEESFRRAITAHIRGADGRRPFQDQVEAAILKELRKKGTWKCFAKDSTIGKLGYKKYGYHEEARMRKQHGSTDHPPEIVTNKKKKRETTNFRANVRGIIGVTAMKIESNVGQHQNNKDSNIDEAETFQKATVGSNKTAIASTSSTSQVPAVVGIRTFVNTLPLSVSGPAPIPGQGTGIPAYSHIGLVYSSQMFPHLHMEMGRTAIPLGIGRIGQPFPLSMNELAQSAVASQNQRSPFKTHQEKVVTVTKMNIDGTVVHHDGNQNS